MTNSMLEFFFRDAIAWCEQYAIFIDDVPYVPLAEFSEVYGSFLIDAMSEMQSFIGAFLFVGCCCLGGAIVLFSAWRARKKINESVISRSADENK